MRTTLLALALLAAVASTGTAQVDGPWRAALETPGGELPFGLSVSRADGALVVYVVNGDEKLPLAASRTGDTLVLATPHYDSEITATLSADERGLDGVWRKTRGKGKEARVPFHARAGDLPRFPGSSDATTPADVGGRWAVDLESDDEPAVALLEHTEDGAVRGTILTTTGDYRFLAGTVDGTRLRLSCFDGAHAFLFDATLEADDERWPDARLAGVFWSGDWWHTRWTARRDDSITLPDPFAQTTWDERTRLSNLVLPDLDGRLRNLGDPEFAGRATLLQLFGSWCPNCHDETAYLVELHRRYRDRGLSILGLAFELTGEHERDAEQVRRFAAKHGVEYPLFVCGLANKARATAAFPAVDRVRSYPTTIFLGGDGRVRAVHSGWAGPAAGEEHDRVRAEFERWIEELLAEEPPTDARTWQQLTPHPWYDVGAFAGATYTFHEDDTGRRRARHVVFGSGRPVLSDESLAVALSGDAVRVGERVWRFDSAAGVLLEPTSVGNRLVPYKPGQDPAPLLARSGYVDEAGWIRALADERALVRREAVVRLSLAREPVNERGLAEVVALLDDPEPEVRAAAAWGCGRCHEAAARERLLELLASDHAPTRREAAASIARMATRSPALLLALVHLEDDPDPRVRDVARAALRDR